jgi:uncharacterized protein
MTTVYQDRAITAPVPTPENQAFFDAAARGELLIKRCLACGEVHHLPRTICPHCFSDRTEWVAAKGTGTIYTFSVSRRVLPTPYAIAYVTLDEGISMMTNIVDCDLDALEIGQAVRVVFKPSDGGPPVPMFTPV